MHTTLNRLSSFNTSLFPPTVLSLDQNFVKLRLWKKNFHSEYLHVNGKVIFQLIVNTVHEVSKKSGFGSEDGSVTSFCESAR
jgi:hypothetical protein